MSQGTFGDLLEQHQKESLISPNVEIGQVYKMALTPTEGVVPKNKSDKDRDKYFVVIGIHKGVAVGSVLINSSINRNIPQELKDLHYPLKPSDYPFLIKNSFVDCSEIKTISLSIFTQKFSVPYCTICEDDLRYIKDAICSSPKTTDKELKYGLK
jgi:hypothetical protein